MDDNELKQTIVLPSGCTLHVDEHRTLIKLPSIVKTKSKNESDYATEVKPIQWKAISSAIWNGGSKSFRQNDNSEKESSHIKRSPRTDKSENVYVLNYRMPSTYDGFNPDPKSFLQNAINNESYKCDERKTIGLMTATSMRSLRTASRSASGIIVDVIVTAGISNARAVGADADCFFMFSSKKQASPPGTINTVVIINAPMSDEAMIEAYAIVIEAKCAACADLKLTCAKSFSGSDLAQGTGTDCAVLLTASSHNEIHGVIEYSGKHMLIAEMIGQAVREATRESILSNICHIHGGSCIRYRIYRWYRSFMGILQGARPCIPPFPMMPVPSAPLSVIVFGLTCVIFSYSIIPYIGHSASVLIAATCWDRCLPEPPLTIHPVCLAGSIIDVITTKIPHRVYQSPILGFSAGVIFLFGVLSLFLSAAYFIQYIAYHIGNNICNAFLICDRDSLRVLVAFTYWIIEVILFKSTFSLQLLCTITLQMARFIERTQLAEARSQLSWLCSRDPTNLNSEELAASTLESLSENLSDGTIAPWFWFLLFGPLGALSYRIVNTLDSRVGYRGLYEWFGKASARFDDLINFIPSRITALTICIASIFVTGCNPKRGLSTAWNDCNQCSSPNAGWPMSAMAGVLSVRLEKKGEYCLGKNNLRQPTPMDLRIGHRIAQLAGGIMLILAFTICVIIDSHQIDWVLLASS